MSARRGAVATLALKRPGVPPALSAVGRTGVSDKSVPSFKAKPLNSFRIIRLPRKNASFCGKLEGGKAKEPKSNVMNDLTLILELNSLNLRFSDLIIEIG